MIKILLVDDDPDERNIVERALHLLSPGGFVLEHVRWCSEALDRMNNQLFDLVLLDNRLTRSITAEFTAPMLKTVKYPAPIAITSNDTQPLYLSDPAILGVDYIVDKSDLIGFLKGQISQSVSQALAG